MTPKPAFTYRSHTVEDASHAPLWTTPTQKTECIGFAVIEGTSDEDPTSVEFLLSDESGVIYTTRMTLEHFRSLQDFAGGAQLCFVKNNLNHEPQ
jgi:hypothetical protein